MALGVVVADAAEASLLALYGTVIPLSHYVATWVIAQSAACGTVLRPTLQGGLAAAMRMVIMPSKFVAHTHKGNWPG